MSEANRKTLNTYDTGVQNYINGTVKETNGFQREWLDSVLEDVPVNSQILEIGAAFGRDAKYMKSLGYEPDLTDASKGFVEYLRQHEYNATELNIIDNMPEKFYDVIVASAVFLHFTDEDFSKAIHNVRERLTESGKFAFSVKKGDGEAWSEFKMEAPRYFKYWQADEITTKLAQIGMRTISLDQRAGKEEWLHVTCVRS